MSFSTISVSPFPPPPHCRRSHTLSGTLLCLVLQHPILLPPGIPTAAPQLGVCVYVQVTRETELNFEYQVRSREERRSMGLQTDGRVLSSPVVRRDTTLLETPAARAAPTTPGAPGRPGPFGTLDTPGPPVPRGTPGARNGTAGAAPDLRPSGSPRAKGGDDGETQAFLPFQVREGKS